MSNGVSNGHHTPEPALKVTRFSHIPSTIDIPVGDGQAEEAVEVDLEKLQDDPAELLGLLEAENAAKGYWITIALAYAKQGLVDLAVDIITRGLGFVGRGKADEKLALYNCLCWLHLLKARDAPRMKLGEIRLDVLEPVFMLTLFYCRCESRPGSKDERPLPSCSNRYSQ